MNSEFKYREIISALYRAILRREPDEQGLKFYSEHLEKNGPNDIPAIVYTFINSEEYINRNAPGNLELSSMLKRIIAPDDEFLYISLGTHCYTGSLLKQCGKKNKSHPFDWIFSTPEMVAHCLETDFSEFLRREHYDPVPEDKRPHGKEVNLCQHTYYLKSHGVHFVFNHHNPINDEDYSYLTRCVERFRMDRESELEKKYVMFTRHCSEATFHRLLAALPSSKSRLLCILVNDARTGFGWNEKLRVGPSRLLEYQSKSPWGGLEFADPIDDLLLAKLITEHY